MLSIPQFIRCKDGVIYVRMPLLPLMLSFRSKQRCSDDINSKYALFLVSLTTAKETMTFTFMHLIQQYLI